MFQELCRYGARALAVCALAAGAATAAQAETAIVQAALDNRIYIGQGETLQLAKRAALENCTGAGYETCRIVWICEHRGWLAITRFQSKEGGAWGASCGHQTRAEADHAAVTECNARVDAKNSCPYPMVEYFEKGSQEVADEGRSLVQQCRGACAGDCNSGLRACMCFQQCERDGVDRIWPLFLPTAGERQYLPIAGERR